MSAAERRPRRVGEDIILALKREARIVEAISRMPLLVQPAAQPPP